MQEYIDAKKLEKDIQDRISEIRSLIIAENGFNTKDYCAVITEKTRESVNQDAIKAVYGQDFFKREGFMKTTCYPEVKVYKKG